MTKKNCIHSYLKDICHAKVQIQVRLIQSYIQNQRPKHILRKKDGSLYLVSCSLRLKSKAYRNNIMLSCVSAGRYLSCWYETRSYHNWLLFELWGLTERERESSPVRLGCCDGRLIDATVTVADHSAASPGPPLPQRLAIKKLKESGWRLEL